MCASNVFSVNPSHSSLVLESGMFTYKKKKKLSTPAFPLLLIYKLSELQFHRKKLIQRLIRYYTFILVLK